MLAAKSGPNICSIIARSSASMPASSLATSSPAEASFGSATTWVDAPGGSTCSARSSSTSMVTSDASIVADPAALTLNAACTRVFSVVSTTQATVCSASAPLLFPSAPSSVADLSSTSVPPVAASNLMLNTGALRSRLTSCAFDSIQTSPDSVL